MTCPGGRRQHPIRKRPGESIPRPRTHAGLAAQRSPGAAKARLIGDPFERAAHTGRSARVIRLPAGKAPQADPQPPVRRTSG